MRTLPAPRWSSIYITEKIWKKHEGKSNPDVNYSFGGVRVLLNLCAQDGRVYRAETSSTYSRAIMKRVALIQSQELVSDPLHFICLVFGELNKIATFPSVKNWQKTVNEF